MTTMLEKGATLRKGANLEVARRLWAGISSADLHALRELMSEKLQWISHGQGTLAGRFSGPDAALSLMARSGEIVDELDASLVDMYASERGAIIRYRLQAERGPHHLDTEHLLVLEIEEEQITGLITVPVNQRENDRFFAPH